MRPKTLLAARADRAVGWLALALAMGVQVLLPHVAAAQTSSNQLSAIVISLAGTVEILPKGATNWVPAQVGQSLEIGYQLRTGPRSRAMIRLSNLSVLRVGERMTYEIEAPRIAHRRQPNVS
jgi:hypothetical protein